MPLLPLFPLGTVLLPGGSLPLQIFERRYVVLLNDLLGETGTSLGSAEDRALRRGSGRSDSVPSFGVVALRRGHEVGAESVQSLFEVGCVARIEAAVRHPARPGCGTTCRPEAPAGSPSSRSCPRGRHTWSRR